MQLEVEINGSNVDAGGLLIICVCVWAGAKAGRDWTALPQYIELGNAEWRPRIHNAQSSSHKGMHHGSWDARARRKASYHGVEDVERTRVEPASFPSNELRVGQVRTRCDEEEVELRTPLAKLMGQDSVI